MKINLNSPRVISFGIFKSLAFFCQAQFSLSGSAQNSTLFIQVYADPLKMLYCVIPMWTDISFLIRLIRLYNCNNFWFALLWIITETWKNEQDLAEYL